SPAVNRRSAMSPSLYTLIEASFPQDGTRIALEAPDRTRGPRDWSFDRLKSTAARYAALFSGLGLAAGDRIALQVEKSPEALAIYLACLRGGFVFLPMNTAYRPDEVDYLVGDAEPALVICDPSAEVSARDIAVRHGTPHVLTLDAEARGSFIEAASKVTDALPPAACGANDL